MIEPHQTFQKKFVSEVSPEKKTEKVPVFVSLGQLVQNQSLKIERLLEKKRDRKRKIQKISVQNLQYRQKLKQKILEEQKKHSSVREKEMQKITKQEKYRIKSVFQRKNQHEQKLKAKEYEKLGQFEKHKAETKNFWVGRSDELARKYKSQEAVQTVYEDAVSRKKFKELRNDQYGEIVKDKLIQKHKPIKERVQRPIQDYKQYLSHHNVEDLIRNKQRNIKIENQKESKFVNDLLSSQQKSNKLLKVNQKKWQKQLKDRKIDEKIHFSQTKKNFVEREMQRTMSMKECRCHDRGQNMNNAEDQSENQLKGSNTLRNWSVVSMRNSSRKNQFHEDIVKNNKGFLTGKREEKDNKKLKFEEDITKAIQLRNSIKIESNSYVRKARMIEV